jgi:rod shape-determining protein MreD
MKRTPPLNSIGYKPFEKSLAPSRARAVPWVSVMLGSCLTAIPVIVTVPLLPPAGLLMLLSWRLLARFSLRHWAAAPLGLFDDLVSGQPLGSAVLLWSLTFLLIEMIEARLVFRDFWQDWLIAGGAIAFCLILGRFIAVPVGAHVDGVLWAQIVITTMLFPLTARLVAWIDRKRGAE